MFTFAHIEFEYPVAGVSTVLMNFCLMLNNEVFKEFYLESGKILMQVARFISFATFIIHI